jgi:hypothetical protein
VLALQRTAGNRAVLRMLEARRAPNVLQRAVDTTAARKENKHFAAAESVILKAIAAANGELWQMVNDDSAKVDLVFRADLGLMAGVGEVRPMAFYGQKGKEARIEDLMHDGVDLKDERITIEVQVVPPVLTFWDRNAGQAAGTVAHEYAIHAERYTKIIRHIRAEGSVGKAVIQLNKWADEGEFEAGTHHASIFQEDEYNERYRQLSGLMTKLFVEAGMNDEAAAVQKAFDEDISEHRAQAFFGGNKHRKKERRSLASRLDTEMARNHAAIQQAKEILAKLPDPPPLPIVETLEDAISNR